MTPADYDRLLTVIRALLGRQTRVIAAIDGLSLIHISEPTRPY